MIPALSSTTAYSVSQLPTRPGQPEGEAAPADAALPSDRPASPPQDAQQAASTDLRAEQRVAGAADAEPVQLSREQPLRAGLALDARTAQRDSRVALDEREALTVADYASHEVDASAQSETGSGLGPSRAEIAREESEVGEVWDPARRRERLEALEEAQAQREQRAAAMVEYQQQMAEVQARLAEVQRRLAQLGVLDPQYLLGGLIDDQA